MARHEPFYDTVGRAYDSEMLFVMREAFGPPGSIWDCLAPGAIRAGRAPRLNDACATGNAEMPAHAMPACLNGYGNVERAIRNLGKKRIDFRRGTPYVSPAKCFPCR